MLGGIIHQRQGILHILDDLISEFLQPRGGIGGSARGQRHDGDAVVIGQNTDQLVGLVTAPGDGVGQAVDVVAGRLAPAGIQGFTGQTGSPHLLDVVAEGITDALDVAGLGLALDVHTGQVSGVVADDLGKAGLFVAVVGEALGPLRDIVSHREHLERGKLGILLVVGLGLDVVQLPGKEHRRRIRAVKAHTGGARQGSGDVGVLQRQEVRLVIEVGRVIGVVTHDFVHGQSSFRHYRWKRQSSGYTAQSRPGRWTQPR